MKQHCFFLVAAFYFKIISTYKNTHCICINKKKWIAQWWIASYQLTVLIYCAIYFHDTETVISHESWLLTMQSNRTPARYEYQQSLNYDKIWGASLLTKTILSKHPFPKCLLLDYRGYSSYSIIDITKFFGALSVVLCS